MTAAQILNADSQRLRASPKLALYTLNLWVSTTIAAAYCFRSVLIRFGLRNLPVYLTILAIMLNIIGLRTDGPTIRKSRKIISFFLIGGLCLVAGVAVNGLFAALFGFSAFFLNFAFWMVVLLNARGQSEAFFSRYFRALCVMGVLSALVALYQYFFDFYLLGFNLHQVYGNRELIESGKVTKRAFALVGSPQNFALLMAVVFGLIAARHEDGKRKALYLVLIGLGGIVSGSRAFSIMTLAFVALNGLTSRRYRTLTVLAVLGGVAFLVTTGLAHLSSSTFGRLVAFDIGSWATINVFARNFELLRAMDPLFGYGLGFGERLLARFQNVDDVSTESFIWSLLLQGGVVCLGGFAWMYASSIVKAFRSRHAVIGCLVLALGTNLLATPSFNGLPMSFIAYPIILYPFFLQGRGRDMAEANEGA